MQNIILIGPPFSGKGTQSELIVEKHHLVHLSTGAAIRAEQDRGSEAGKMAKQYSDQGILAPDELLETIVRSFLAQNSTDKGYLLDGYPRNLAQVETLEKLFAEVDLKITAFVFLQVPEAELMPRAAARAEKENRPDDKDPAVIRRRLGVYEDETFPIVAFAEERGYALHRINGVGSESEILERIEQAIF